MFEKEAEEYKLLHTHYEAAKRNDGSEYAKSVINVTIQEAFQQGAEFGYDKANEWHFVKDGEYPIDEKDVEVLYQDCDKTNVYNCIYDIHAKNWLYYNLDNMVLEPFSYHVIAWKEIVLPKEN